MVNFYGTQLKTIDRFKNLILRYFDNETLDPETRKEIRTYANRINAQVRQYIIDANLPTTISEFKYGTSSEEIDLVGNIFQIGDKRGMKSQITDLLDMTYGHYKLLRKNRISKILNPFCWPAEIIKAPFYIGQFANISSAEKLEATILGKAWKFTAAMVMFIAAIFTIITSIIVILDQFDISITSILGK